MARSRPEAAPEVPSEAQPGRRGAAPAEAAAGGRCGARAPLGLAGAARDRLALALYLVALALGLSLFARLGRPSLWFDEALTWIDSHDLGQHYNWAGYALVRWTVELCGGAPDEAKLRLAPAFAGWLAVAATAWAFAPLAGARRAALAALLVAASPWQLYWSQNARFYTFAEVATLAGTGLLLRGLAGGGLVRIVLGLAVAVSGTLFHLEALLAVGALAVAAVVVRPALEPGHTGVAPAPGRRERTAALARRLGIAGLVLVAVAAPAAFGVFDEYRRAKGGSAQDVVSAVLALGYTIGPGLGAGFLVGAALAARSRDGVFALAVPLLGLGAIVGLGFFAKTTAQYAFVFLPWIALVAAWPVGPGGSLASTGRTLAWALVLVLPLVASSALQLGPRYGDRARWREAFAHVEARRAPGDLVVCLPGPIAEFYLARGAAVPSVGDALEAAAWPTRMPEYAASMHQWDTRVFEAPARDARPLWVVVRTDYLLSLAEADRWRVTAFLRDECRLDARFPVRIDARDLDVEVWRRE